MTAPFTWAWNRNESEPVNVTPEEQDYTIELADFSYLEKVAMTIVSGKDEGDVWEITDGIRNSLSQGLANPNKPMRPQSACVFLVDYGTSLQLRFGSFPDQNYTATLVYQKLIAPMTSVTSEWTVPDQYADIYDNLFLADMMAVCDDARSVQYRQRGIATLLAKSEGLTDMDKNLFMEQYWTRYNQTQTYQLRTQQGQAARGI